MEDVDADVVIEVELDVLELESLEVGAVATESVVSVADVEVELLDSRVDIDIELESVLELVRESLTDDGELVEVVEVVVVVLSEVCSEEVRVDVVVIWELDAVEELKELRDDVEVNSVDKEVVLELDDVITVELDGILEFIVEILVLDDCVGIEVGIEELEVATF